VQLDEYFSSESPTLAVNQNLILPSFKLVSQSFNLELLKHLLQPLSLLVHILSYLVDD
jgi:hypothetical protein